MIMTSQGPRTPDLVLENSAHEVKVGYVPFNERIQTQIMKDGEILARQLGGITQFDWDLLRSSTTGRIGADPRTLNMLAEFEIGINMISRSVLSPTLNQLGLFSAGAGLDALNPDSWSVSYGNSGGQVLGKKQR